MRPLILAVAALTLFACANEAKEKTSGRPAVGARLNCRAERFVPGAGDIPRLEPSESCAKFVGYLVASLTEQRFRYGGRGIFTSDTSGIPAVAEADSGGEPAGYSTTNVQEAGVDEGDFVKTDGKHIYLLHGNTLQVVTSWPPTSLAIAAELEIEGTPVAMVLYGERLAIMSSRFEYYGDVVVLAAERAFEPRSRLTVVNVADAAKPVVERTIDMEASYVDMRLVNGRALVVGAATLVAPEINQVVFDNAMSRDEVKAEIARAITATTFDQWLPTMVDSAAGKRELMVDGFDALYTPTVTGAVGTSTVVSLDLANPGAAVNKVALMSDGGLVYANADALYIAYPNWAWWWSQTAETYLHRLRLNAEALPQYTGSVVVSGWIDTPFWLSEFDEHLRVVSSGDKNRLTVYDVSKAGDPVKTGEVVGYAPGEQITGVRLMGARGYVSTYFVQFLKDPFFTFDLADPAKPTLVGALEMPGFTSYIHPLSDDYVLALGMFAPSMGDPVTAVQVQVFDVRDFANPVTAAQHVIATGSDGRSFSEALWSHHAFTFYEPLGLFAFPVSIFDGNWSSSFNGLVAMRVGDDASLGEIGRVNHLPLGEYGDWWWSDVRRSIVMEADDGKAYLYSISSQAVVVNAVNDLDPALDAVLLPPGAFDAMSAEPGIVR